MNKNILIPNLEVFESKKVIFKKDGKFRYLILKKEDLDNFYFI